MFFLVAALAAREPGHAEPYVWMGIELIVGTMFIAGILGINRVVAALLENSE